MILLYRAVYVLPKYRYANLQKIVPSFLKKNIIHISQPAVTAEATIIVFQSLENLPIPVHEKTVRTSWYYH